MADIELVIKIPEDEYRWIKKSDETAFANVASKECMLYAIKNGTPLPKGHGKLIDADVLVDGFEDNYEFCEVVNATPTIIEADKEDEE